MWLIKKFLILKIITYCSSYYKGKLAEYLASSYLQHHQWTIIARNYKTKFAEIDILAIKNQCLVAFEIKYRGHDYQLLYAINTIQQQRIKKCLLYFQKYNKQYVDYYLRCDAIFINHNQLKHIQNAW